MQVILTDNVTKEEQQLKLKVIPPYLHLEIVESTDPFWIKINGLFLVQDIERSFYMCRYRPAYFKYAAPPVCSGTYEIITEGGNPSILRLRSEDKKFIRDFRLSHENEIETLKIFNQLSKSKIFSYPRGYSLPLFLAEDNMGILITAGIGYKTEHLPENVLK